MIIYLYISYTLPPFNKRQTSFFSSHEPVTPQEALSGPNMAFRGYGKLAQPNSLGFLNRKIWQIKWIPIPMSYTQLYDPVTLLRGQT